MTSAQIIFNLAIALRRVLIRVDKRSAAAKYAERILAEADAALKAAP